MFSPFFKFTALALVIAGVIAQTTLTINTPQVSFSLRSRSWLISPQFQRRHLPAYPSSMDWRSSITSGDDSSGATIQDLGTQNDNSETYTPTVQANTRIVFNIRDSTGLIAQTGIITVGAGSTTTCSTSAASGSTAASGGATASGTTGGSTGATTGSGSSTKTTGTSTGTSTGSSSTSSGNAASAQLSGAGFAGVIGAALVALLA
ncbi:hypothetical protein BDZ89DRAFT_1125843 [Hymenopellis radicata]|nr:hypothetical protein BDZ89DRAFT_1125843 [Hymenopellis radicata]